MVCVDPHRNFLRQGWTLLHVGVTDIMVGYRNWGQLE